MSGPKYDRLGTSDGERSTQVSLDNLAEAGALLEPGLLLVFAAGQPACTVLPLSARATEIGRGHGIFAEFHDATLSRQHAQVAYRDSEFVITDLGSRNGSALDGQSVQGSVTAAAGSVLRLGHSLFLLCADLRPYRRFGVSQQGERVEGPALRGCLLAIAKAVEVSRNLFLSGESGTGKELLARSFHDLGPQRQGPFLPVNCAALADGGIAALAETAQLLQAAQGGTLFLDEVADLALPVQARLLRVLQSSAVALPGPPPPHLCCATNRNLRQLIAEGRFRADLFFRIGSPQLQIPPLRQRREEIPWLLAGALRRIGAALAIHSTLVEACLLRPWPGNVRELLAEVNTALIAALTAGDAAVAARHLSAAAGAALPAIPETAAAPEAEDPAAPDASHQTPEPEDDLPAQIPTRAEVLATMDATHGNVSAAARVLGMHRTQLRRRLRQYGWVAKKLG